MNIMLVSVTERIREIGLRKALGATPRVIRRQFLVEASVLGLIGGALGVLARDHRRDLPARRSSATRSRSAPPPWSARSPSPWPSASLFGVYPASRAATSHPIDALRSE